MTRILAIEDDPAIRRGVIDALKFSGYDTLEAANRKSGLELALSARYDLLLLDLVLPDGNGLDILRELRAVHPAVPVIVLTARGDEADRIEGLRRGADDYVVKPFSVRELVARIEAVLRRSPERPAEVNDLSLPCGNVDLNRCEIVYHDGERSDLSEREIETLRYLVGHAGRTITREELISRVWKIDPRGLSTRAVDMQIARLREKLRDAAGSSQLIRTVRGKGYLFEGGASA